MLNIISLGAGVQSTAMALMAAAGEIKPMPDCAIFADTGAEPKAVYRQLEFLSTALPFPIHTVSNGSLYDDLIAGVNSTSNRFAAIPFFTKFEGTAGMGRRQCTKEYKIEPLTKAMRRLLGYAPYKRIPANSCSVWLGISTDEVMRVKPSRNTWQVHRWPLIENGLSRNDCLRWLERNGYPEPPKSACSFCPYRSDHSWRNLKKTDPEAWQEAVRVDEAIAQNKGRMKSELFLHRSLKRLADVDLSTAEDHGQLNMFNNECEGMCGV